MIEEKWILTFWILSKMAAEIWIIILPWPLVSLFLRSSINLNFVSFQSCFPLGFAWKWLGLQLYTELSSIRDMGSGEPAYRIASRIFARFTNFLEPVVVLKIGKFPDKIYCVSTVLGSHYFRWNVCGFHSMHESVFALRDPLNLKISIIGKHTASGFRFYWTHSTPSRNPSVSWYQFIKISTVSLDIIFTCIQVWYITWLHARMVSLQI